MGYTPEMKELIKRVEATRAERVERTRRGEYFKPMTLDERHEVLSRFHPDYMPEGRKALRLGPNKGDVYPEEVVDCVEAYPRIDPDKVDFSKIPNYVTDVLVIGAGGAGTSAALMAAKAGLKVVLATKLRHGDANTVMAEGGIQGADHEFDSPYYHFIDAMGGGHFTNRPELVAALTHDAPVVLSWLEDLGMMFDKKPDGRMLVRHGGGTCRKRMHSAGDMTGSEIMRVLRDEARSRTDMIELMEFTAAVEILKDKKGRAAGALMYNMETEEYFAVRAKAVVIATGGNGRLHIQGFACTNHYGATADGLVIGYRAGCSFDFLHSTQYHPTGAAYPEQNVGLLITEKVRGLGANLLNIDGVQFVFEREPRDVESAAIIRECTERGKGIRTPVGRLGVWLDSPMIEMLEGPGAVEKELPAKFMQFIRYGIDIRKEPMLIYPTLHYQNGGIKINANAETGVPGLFAAGEVTGGVHGENRLMGNSLLDVTVFGRRAGKSAAAYINSLTEELGEPTLDHVREFTAELKKLEIEEGRIGPILLPDYTTPEVRERQLTAHYEGTIR